MHRLLFISLLVVDVHVCMGWMVPGSTEIGVLSCTGGHPIDTQISSQTSPAGESREMLCSFKPHQGPEEAYNAVVKSVGAAAIRREASTMLWVVRAPMGTEPTSGLLQQSYTADAGTPVGQTAPLVGEKNNAISLQPMYDKKEGSASKEKAIGPTFKLTAVELVLKASVG